MPVISDFIKNLACRFRAQLPEHPAPVVYKIGKIRGYKDMSEYILPMQSETTTFWREIPFEQNLPQTYLPGVTRTRLSSVVPGYKVTIKKSGKNVQTDKFIQLVEAIEKKQHDKLKEILKDGLTAEDIIDPSSKTTILHVASKYGKSETWKALFSEPELIKCIDTQDSRGTTPLIAASWYNNADAVEALVERNANLGLHIHDTKRTALHCGADLATDKIVRLLLRDPKKQFFIDAMDYEGNTPLMLAVNADSPSVTPLIEEGADLLKQNTVTGRNILHMSIVNNNLTLIEMLIDLCDNSEFLDALDKNGDSPFTLAMRLDNDAAIDILLQASNLGAVLSRSLLSLHTIVELGKTSVIGVLLRIVDDKTIFNFIDDYGRTVLMHAIDRRQTKMVKLMLKYGVNYKVRNYRTGETVLHAAAYANNEQILDQIFALSEINEIMNAVDYRGLTAYDIVLGKAGREIWLKFLRTGLVTREYRNVDKETPLFIAAKEGNIFLVQSLLLSDKFNRFFDSHPMTLDRNELVLLELKGLIYASDVFICCEYDVGGRGWKLSPEQTYHFEHNVHDQNIFHACALGESVDCAALVYNFCSIFYPKILDDFDKPDRYGNTPLMFSIECGSKPLARYYMKKGSNMAYENNINLMPLDRLNNNLPYWQPLIISVLDKCAILEYERSKKEIPFGELTLNCDILCPKDIPQMHVVSSIFERLKGRECMEILESPVIEYFVLTKWSRITDMIGLRFIMYSFLVIFLSTYLCFTLCYFLDLDPFLNSALQFILFFLSALMVLFNCPLLFMKKRKLFLLFSVCPICTILYLFINLKTRGAIELGAMAILSGWMSIVVQGYVTRMSFQVAMFFQVVQAGLSHLPMFFLLLFGFSNCFFVLFHDFYSFNNPVHSFLTTSLFLLFGENALPTFNIEMEPLYNRKNLYEILDEHKQVLNGEYEMRGMLVEGSILLFFDIIVGICMLNLLVGLAVKSSSQLEKEGSIHRIKTYVEEMTVWENFMNTRFYKIVSHLKIAYIFGLFPAIKQRLQVPTVFRPMSEHLEVEFNLQKLKYAASETIDTEEDKHVSFRKLLMEERFHKKGILSRGSKASSNISWIYTKMDLG